MKRARKLFKSGWVASLVAAVMTMGVLSGGAQAADGKTATTASTKSKSTASHSSSHTSGSITTLKREMASLHAQFKSLIEEVSALQDRVTGLQSAMDDLAAGRRLRDIEKAISDLNGKAVANANIAEEAKTQALDLSRKLKIQQDAIDLLRNQVDRLQQQVIQSKTRDDSAAEAAPDGKSGGGQ